MEDGCESDPYPLKPTDVPKWGAQSLQFTRNLKTADGPAPLRMGVPGHPSYTFYRFSDTLTIWPGSAWQVAFNKNLFWLHQGIFLAFVLLFSFLHDSPLVSSLTIQPATEGRLHSVGIFTVTFYSASVYATYRARADEIFRTNGSITIATGLAPRLVGWSYSKARAVLRYANAMMFANYASMSGPMDEKKWSLAHSRGLLETAEVELLLASGGDFSTVIYSWATAIVREAYDAGVLAIPEMAALLTHLGTIRGLSAKQIGRQLLQRGS
eukprot:jgi/Tetstr1/461547/TSEL_006653.t1